MKKALFFSISFLLFELVSVLMPMPSLAVGTFTDEAELPQIEFANDREFRIFHLKSFLMKNNSPLAEHAELLVKTAEEEGLPWSLVAAISGIESSFCKAIPYQSYNCWGWNNGVSRFTDYPDAIKIVSQTLKHNYFDRGLDTPEKISPVYAPPSQTWASKVRYFMNLIENSYE